MESKLKNEKLASPVTGVLDYLLTNEVVSFLFVVLISVFLLVLRSVFRLTGLISSLLSLYKHRN